MGRVVRAVIGAALIVVGAVTGNFQLIFAGATVLGGALLGPKGSGRRAATAAQVQLGEQPRQAIFGRFSSGGSLVDAFNYGGRYGTDWEVLVLALADHRCDALEGFYVDDTFHAFVADGNVAGFNNQLQVFWRNGQWAQSVPTILTTNGPGWTANDRGRGVAYVVVAYKGDAQDAKNPVWPGGRPRFGWVVRGLRCYDPRLDTSVGGSGAHRRDNPATWAWSENPIVIRHNWVRGIYAGDFVAQPEMLLVGRGLSAIEAPPANVFARANLCDEVVGGAARYRIGGVAASNEPFIEVESDFAAACAGVISQPEGAVEVDPGEAKAPVAHFTDADLIVGSTVRFSDFLGQDDDGWVNTVVASFIDPAQRYTERSAPVRRDLADITADKAPRELRLPLQMVTNAPQAQRVAEVARRFGRLWRRATVTLPPRFAFIEEGDWVTWQSDRHMGGATFTFRVEAWGSDRSWHHQLTMRQISSSVYSDTAPLTDGGIASNRSPPPVVAAPDPGVWNAAAVLLGSGSVQVPNLRIAGTPDDPAAQFVVFEYVPQVAAPDTATIWTFASNARPDVRLLDIPVPEGGTYYVAVSYVVDGIQGPRRVLGPISTAGLAFADGSPIAPVAPANTNLVQFSRMEGGLGWFNLAQAGMTITTGVRPVNNDGRVFIQTNATSAGAGQTLFTQTAAAHRFIVNGNSRLSVALGLEALSLGGGPAPSVWGIQVVFFDAAGISIPGAPTVAQGAGNSLASTRREAFITAPANAVRGYLEVFLIASGAGTVQLSIVEPMIAVAVAGQTVHPSYTPGQNAFDGALPNNLITVDGSGLLSGIGTANIVVDNRQVPTGANAVVNSDFTRGKFGWRWRGGVHETSWGVNLPSWFGQRNVMWANVPGVFTSGSTADLSPDALWDGGSIANAPLFALPVVQGDRVAATVLAAPHRCAFRLFMLFFDGAGAWIAFAPFASGGASGGAANGDPANFELLTVIDTAPANARWAIPMMRMIGIGQTDPFIFFTEPMLSKIAAGQTIAPRYSPGRGDSLGQPNTDITIDGAGLLSGIGTGGVFVDNGRIQVDLDGNIIGIGSGSGTPVSNIGVVLSGTLAARPGSGAFVGQTYVATDTREFFRWNGSGWVTASDLTAAAQVTTSQPSSFQIQANSSGTTTTVLSTQTRSAQLFRGGAALTSGVTVGATSATTGISIASATISGGIVTVTLSTANASGSVTVNLVFGGVPYPVTIQVTRAIAAPVAGGSGSQPFTDQTWTNIDSTSFVAVTDAGASVLSTSGGQLSFDFNAQYDGGTAICKAQYSLNNSTWTDVPGTETTGSAPITVPGEEQPGEVTRSNTLLSDLTGSTLYYVRLVARRSAGSTTLSWISPAFTARQP
jgi:hypothetical protein